ncbi:unnamed protein product [Leuciscus chuanchicus]
MVRPLHDGEKEDGEVIDRKVDESIDIVQERENPIAQAQKSVYPYTSLVYTQETRRSSLGLHSAASVDSCLTPRFFPRFPLGSPLLPCLSRKTAPGSSPLMYHVKTPLGGMGFSLSHQMKHPCAGGWAADTAVDQTKAGDGGVVGRAYQRLLNAIDVRSASDAMPLHWVKEQPVLALHSHSGKRLANEALTWVKVEQTG